MLNLLLLAPILGASPSTTDDVVAPRIQAWELTAPSEVGYDGTSTLHDWTGRTRSLSGELCAALDDPGAASGAWIEVVAADLDSDNSMRDSEMRDRLDVEHHPRIRFELDSVLVDEALAGSALDVEGRFEIHGVSRARTVRVSLEREGDRLHVAGRTRFRMSEHGITPPDMLVVTVDDEIEVWFDLHFVPRTDARLEAEAWTLDVHEVDHWADGATGERDLVEGLWRTERGLLLESVADRRWTVASDGRVRTVHPLRAELEPAPRSIEEAFAASRAQAAELRRRIEGLPEAQRERVGAALARTAERLERALEFAPRGELAVEADAERLVIRIGEQVWAEFEGLHEGPALGPLLAEIDGVPSGVRERLRAVAGLPTHVRLRTATPAGLRELEIEVGGPAVGAVPAADLAPEGWCRAAEEQR